MYLRNFFYSISTIFRANYRTFFGTKTSIFLNCSAKDEAENRLIRKKRLVDLFCHIKAIEKRARGVTFQGEILLAIFFHFFSSFMDFQKRS